MAEEAREDPKPTREDVTRAGATAWNHSGRPAVALTVAGSDSGGGAGIQADLRTFHAFGVFGTSAVTAVTVQDTTGVSGVQKIDPDVVGGQIEVVCRDLRPGSAKTGMLADAAIIRIAAGTLERVGPDRLVVDPVMVAASGDPLLEPEAVEALREELLPLAAVVTPNLHEAEILAGFPVKDEGGMRRAAEEIVARGAGAALVKGGHLEGDEVLDLLFDGAGWREWRAPRLETRAGHGTGCTLSAAIAAGLALDRSLGDAVDAAIRFTRRALETAPDLGEGTAPLNHWVTLPDVR